MRDQSEDDRARAEKIIYERTRLVLRDLFKYGVLEGWGEPRIEIGPHADTGTSALMMRAHARLKLIVKVHQNPDDTESEAAGYQILREGPQDFWRHLVPPLPIGDQKVLWLTPLLDAHTLYADVWAHRDSGSRALTDQFIAELYADVLDKMRLLWTETRSPSTPALQAGYLSQVGKAFDSLQREFEAHAPKSRASSFWNLQVEVNGRNFGSLRDIREDFHTQVYHLVTPERVPFSCITHGDEHPKNIMIGRPASDPKSWALVDFVNAKRQSDWVLSIAKMLYWWRFFCVVERAKSDRRLRRCRASLLQIDGNRLLLTYDEGHIQQRLPRLAARLEQLVLGTAKAIAHQFREDEAYWRDRLRLALFSTAFGSSRRQYGTSDFAVPVLVGEALKAFYDP